MLCYDNEMIGYLGSSFFIGVILTILPVPVLADKYGRYWMMVGTLATGLLSLLLLMVVSDFKMALLLMGLQGMTFAGRLVVNLNYILEFFNLDQQEKMMGIYLYVEPVLGVLISLYYRYVDNSYLSLQILFFFI